LGYIWLDFTKDKSVGNERLPKPTVFPFGAKMNSLKRYAPNVVKRHYRALKSMYDVVPALRKFFCQDTITPKYAVDEIKQILEKREDNFLALAKAQIYDRADSPYLKLLQMVQCDFADLEQETRRHGLESTLAKLAREGVYVTSEEYKGKTPISRGQLSFRVTPEDFICGESSPGFITQSSGTKNPPVHSLVTLEWLRTRALVMSVYFSAHDLFSCRHGIYDSILPASAGINQLLIYSSIGAPPKRWFARWQPYKSRYGYNYLKTLLIVLTGRTFGVNLPWPEFVKSTDVERNIVSWCQENLRLHRPCAVTTSATNATRIAQAAWDMGMPLGGATFVCAGEPVTDTKRAAIERTGAKVTIRFSYGGSVTVGMGCANPLYTDEVHVNDYMLALISHDRRLPLGTTVRPLLCTTFNPAHSRFLFNVENGDYGTLLKRACGCALEKVGLTSHLYHIRSFEKFTSEEMNYYYGNLFEIFEKTFPSEFGGRIGDYQLVEAENAIGKATLTLRVHPRIRDIDENKLRSRLHEELSKESGNHSREFQNRIWQSAGVLRVSREVPFESSRGKILPLYIERERR
jgi:hypothetical protein